MPPRAPLDYESPRASPGRPLQPATRAAVAFLAIGFGSSIIMMSGIERIAAAMLAVGCGLAILGLLRPASGLRARVVQWATLATGAVLIPMMLWG